MNAPARGGVGCQCPETREKFAADAIWITRETGAVKALSRHVRNS